jgi:hypothetical protein
MRLPEPFVARMREELGAEQGAALCAALDTAPPTSLRWNPAKTVPEERCGEPVPWSPEGRYLPSRPQFTLDSDLHAGAYYVQEASSQFLAHLLAEADIAGARVLDLCAAPGGKSTLYASLVGGDGLVVANEINRQRASVLADNVRRWGSGNTVVTLADPAAFGGFAGWFDVVGVDAPCSGEGMFRKLEQARAEWSAQQVGLCARRQQEIIRQAWPLLRPGGLLIYSTCTFNREENERTLEDFAAEAGGELVAAAKVACPESWGVVCGEAGPFQTFRFYPHRARGEGFFAAVARKSFDAGGRVRTPRARRPLLGPVSRRDCAELGRWLREPERMRFAAVGENFYAYSAAQYEAVRTLAESLPVICSGVAMGQLFKGTLRPDAALALYEGMARGVLPEASLDPEQIVAYLRKQELPCGLFAEGMNLVTARGRGLGFAKRIGGRVNNLYPNLMRILMQEKNDLAGSHVRPDKR